MYRPFKEFINARFIAECQTAAPSYKAVKSLTRGGGVTLRKREKSGPSFFLILQHVTDRDMVSLTAGWAPGAWFADWTAAETHYFSGLDSKQRVEFDAILRDSPDRIVAARPEGTFIPGQLDAGIVMHELEVGDGGVPYELIVTQDLRNPEIHARVATFLGAATVQSLAAGCVPPMAPANPAVGLHEPYPITVRLLSWECWFEHVLRRKPDEAELDHLCGPVVRELSRQLALLAAVLVLMETSSQQKSALR